MESLEGEEGAGGEQRARGRERACQREQRPKERTLAASMRMRTRLPIQWIRLL